MRKEKKKKSVWLKTLPMILITVILWAIMIWAIVIPEDNPDYNVLNAVMEVFTYVVIVVILAAAVGFAAYQLFIHTSKATYRVINTLDEFLGDYKVPLLLMVTLMGMSAVQYLSENPRWLMSGLAEAFPDMAFRLPDTEDLFGYYTAQLSLTFISISVMGVLSDGSVLIYWVNASEDRLIKPTFTSFAAYTYYSIGATVGAGLAVFAGRAPMFYGFFIANIVVLILLTVSMIDVYFGKERTKKKLRKRLIRDEQCHKKKLRNKALTVYQQTRAKHYEEAIRGLCQNIYHAQAVSNLSLLSDIYELYFTTTTAFYSKPGPQVPQAIVATLSDQTFPTFYANLDNFVRDIPRQRMGLPRACQDDVLLMDYSWSMDKDLWAALARNRYLAQWVEMRDLTTEDGWELMELLFVIKRRLMQLHNDMVQRYAAEQDWDEDDFLLAMDHEGNVVLEETNEKIPFERVKQVFEAAYGDLMVESGFAAHLVRTMLHLLRREEAAEGVAEHMKDFPIMGLFTANAGMLGLNKEETLLLTYHFPKPTK